MRYFLIILTLLIFTSCQSEEEFSGNLMVTVEYEYEEGANGTYPVADPIPVYLFDILNLLDADYEYIGNGEIKNNDTGEIHASLDSQNLSSGFVYFKDLPKEKYTIALDMLDSKLETYTMTGINLANYEGEGEISLSIDIWPYDPWNLYE